MNGRIVSCSVLITIRLCLKSSTSRANPYAEGTNPICRLPLLTFILIVQGLLTLGTWCGFWYRLPTITNTPKNTRTLELIFTTDWEETSHPANGSASVIYKSTESWSYIISSAETWILKTTEDIFKEKKTLLRPNKPVSITSMCCHLVLIVR